LSETVNIVVSIFGLLGLGYLTVRIGLLSTEVGEKLSDFVFTLAIPLLLFTTLARADFHGISPWRVWAAYFVPFAVIWVLADLTVRLVFRRDRRAGIIGGGSAAYGNSVLLGLPLMHAAFGDSGTLFLVVVLAIHLPAMMMISVALNEWAVASSGAAVDRRPRREVLARLALSLARHPILIGIVAGSLWRATGLAIPDIAARIIDPLARAAGPVALFSCGTALVNYGMARQIRPAIAISVLKLALMPALVFVAARFLGLPPIGVAALTLTAACPTGVNTYLIAVQLGTGQALASNALVISTAASVLTVALWLAFLQTTL
jgi:predicted permease